MHDNGSADKVYSMDVVVQPSVPWMSLNDQIKQAGLFFPVDPGPSVYIPATSSLTSSRFFPARQFEHMLTNASGSNWRHGGHKLQVIKLFC
jgi:FAD/FMN-containing dehydrogenase